MERGFSTESVDTDICSAQKSQAVLLRSNHFQEKQSLENNKITASDSNSFQRVCKWKDSAKG